MQKGLQNNSWEFDFLSQGFARFWKRWWSQTHCDKTIFWKNLILKSLKVLKFQKINEILS